MNNNYHPTPIQPSFMPNLTPVASTSQPKRNPFKLATIILAVLSGLLLTALVLMFLFLRPQPTASPTQKTDSDHIALPDGSSLSIEELTAYQQTPAIHQLLGKIKVVAQPTLPNATIYNTYDNGSPLYQPAAAKTLLSIRHSFGLAAPTTSVQTIQAVKNSLALNGFEFYNEQKIGTQYLNAKDNIICYLGKTPSLDVNCSSTQWITAAQANLSSDLSEAYKTKTSKYPSSLNVYLQGDITIKDSPHRPYQNISVGLDDGTGLFYRSSPDATWVFLRAGSDLPQCAEFNTLNIRRAFVDFTCFNTVTKTNSKVAL